MQDWKLTYLTVTKSDITSTSSVVNQFLSAPRTTHLQAIIKILKYLKEASGRGLLYSNHGHTWVADFSDADGAGCPFDRRSTIEYCLSWRKSCVMEKQEECSLSVQCKIGVHNNDKCDIRANLDQRFVDNNWFPPSVPWDYMVTRQQYTLLKMTCSMREQNTLRLIVIKFARRLRIRSLWLTHVSSRHQLTDLTKPPGKTRIDFICDKLGMYMYML